MVKDGKVVYARGYGVRNLQTREGVNPDTLFYIGSATKSFTATLIAALAEERSDWDRPLRDTFPDFQMFDPAATGKTTFRDLLCHRTGFHVGFSRFTAPPNAPDLIDRLRFFEPRPISDMVSSIATKRLPWLGIFWRGGPKQPGKPLCAPSPRTTGNEPECGEGGGDEESGQSRFPLHHPPERNRRIGLLRCGRVARPGGGIIST